MKRNKTGRSPGTALVRVSLVLGMACLAEGAVASCGAASCSLMTDRYAQGSGETHLGWSADLRVETVTQKQLRRGTTDLDAADVTDEEAIERRTKNLNLVATLDYGIDASWSVALRVPVVHRDHVHDLLDPLTGLPGASEAWRFTRLGDVQATLRWQPATDGPAGWALFGGLKLPTGSIHVTNADGSRAERALQPGSGTTDLVLGVAARRPFGLGDALVSQASWTQALNRREEFRPGRRVELSVGWSHAFSPSFGGVMQLNWRNRARDSGNQAEPDNSGSTMLDLSPGVTFGAGPASTLYAYLQLPLYQRVNGIQLVPRSALAIGWTNDF
jgi:hypothetical protein